MVIGADDGGRLLEIGLILKDNGEAAVIHAMDARPKWRQHDSEGS